MKSTYTAVALLLAGVALFVWLPLRTQNADSFRVPTRAEIETIRNANGKSDEQIRADIDTLLGFLQPLEQRGFIKELASVFHGLGGLYFSIGMVDSAGIFTRKAANMRMGVLRAGKAEPDDLADAAGSFHNLGAIYLNSGNPSAAKVNFDTAIILYRRLGSPKISDSLRDRGNTSDALDDYYEAKDFFTEAIRTAREANDTGLLAQAYIDMGKSLNYQGEWRAALDTLEKALPLLKPDDTYNRFVCCQNIGGAYEYCGQYDIAIANFEKALSYSTYSGDSCRMLNSIGIAKRKSKDLKYARTALTKALKLAEQSESAELVAATYDNTGDVYLAEGDSLKALKQYRKAQDALLGGKKVKSLSVVVNKSDLFTYLFDEGKALCRMMPDSAQQALGAFMSADSLLDLMRLEQRKDESKLLWRRKVVGLYELAIDVCYRAKDTEKAFFFMEKSKSVLLLDALAGLSTQGILGDSLGAIEFNLQNALRDARKSYDEDPGEQWLSAIVTLENKLDAFRMSVTKAFPEYAHVKYGTKVIGIHEIRAFLPDTACFIQYFYGENALFALVIAKGDSTRLIKIEKRKDLDTALLGFANYSAHKDSLDTYPQKYFDLASGIYNSVFAPVLDFRYKKAIIVPDGFLSIIPFDALLTQPYTWNPSKGGFADAPYLLFSLQTQVAWSATILLRYQSPLISDKPLGRQLAFFAPDEFPKNRFVPLNANELLKNIQKIFGKQSIHTFRGNEASIQNFQNNSANYSAFHFHTHAVAQVSSPPCLYFQRDSMRINDFYTMKINTDMFVLGACETNVGTYYSGEGVYSLSRALAYSGVPSIISSLWEVPERSTVNLFNNFYGNLKSGMTKADALHKAKRDFLLKNAGNPAMASPNAWAAWTLSGRDNTLSFNSDAPDFALGWWAAGLALVTLSLLWLFRKNWIKGNRIR